MRGPLRVLILEDNPTDAELMLSILANEDIVCDPVPAQTRKEFIAALDNHTFDLILADHSLPSFDGVSALAIARERCPSTPFIFVSGSMGEELAIETLKRGATDYVLKQRLSRLAPSVRRAMVEAEERAGRQRAERAWREADAMFRSVFDSTAVGMCVLDLTQQPVRTNLAIQSMLGYSDEELCSMKFRDLTLPEDAEKDYDLFRELLADTRPSYQIEKQCRRRDGTLLWARLTVSLIRQPGGIAHLAVAAVEDISGRKGLEEKLLHSQKMEAVGRLAAGIAHDFNNVLTIITGYSSLLLSRTQYDETTLSEIRSISDASQRATALTKRLLGFSRRQPQQLEVLDLNTTVAGLDQMLRCLAGEEVRMIERLAPDLGGIRVDKIQLEQILMNLVINARDAMSTDGELTISTTNISLQEEAAARYEVETGEYVMLSVADTGHGMDEATMARILDPFFTTKEIGSGTGLGLWIVHEIVRQSQGAIVVDSRVNQGTTFKILFPSAGKPGTAKRAEVEEFTPGAGTETILIVEDDEPLRTLMQAILLTGGYRILAAADPGEAILLIEKDKRSIELVLTGYTKTKLESTDLIGILAASVPGVKVLYVSGQGAQGGMRPDSSGPNSGYLPKPFSGATLLQAVRDLLDNSRTADNIHAATILVTDDDPAIRKFLVEVLSTQGYRVLEAANGKVAVDCLRKETVDALITDIIMPDQEGLETIRTAKNDFPEMRIIAMSGGFGDWCLDAARLLGADLILRKPFDASAVCRAVNKVLARSARTTQS